MLTVLSLLLLSKTVTWTIQSILELLRYKARTGPDQIFEISYTWKHGQLQGELNTAEDVEAFVELGHGWCPQDVVFVHFFLPPSVPLLQLQLQMFLAAMIAYPPLLSAP
ncbi:hypothetical protein BDY24DRAFT_30024 [Mrakia frigida]|uniref:uncharacterized protein n=1 Tax=Mrakia frigida TaxID=29902 RepID=UPI003FCC10A6